MATEVTKVKEAVKETLLGSEVPAGVQLSVQSKATFLENAKKDADSGELYMGEEEFINAVAPEGEDYVSFVLYLGAGSLFSSRALALLTTSIEKCSIRSSANSMPSYFGLRIEEIQAR